MLSADKGAEGFPLRLSAAFYQLIKKKERKKWEKYVLESM